MTQSPLTAPLHPALDEELDPELLELPDPPKRERSITVATLLMTAAASVFMVVSLCRDAAYTFRPASAVELGELGSAPSAQFVDNSFVHGSALLGAAHAIRYERPLTAGSFRLMPVAGHPNVWVEVHVESGAESLRYVPPSEFQGRLVRFSSAGPKHRGLASAVRETTGQDVPQDAWLLVEGESPERARWAVLLVAMFLGFAVWNVGASLKLLRRVTS